MAFHSERMKPFPTLSWARPASMRIGGIELEAQVYELSGSGFRLLPRRLDLLHQCGLRLGDPVTAVIDGTPHQAVLAWATPNMSALGCVRHWSPLPLAGGEAEALHLQVAFEDVVDQPVGQE